MTFRSRESLVAWLAEFDAQSRPGALSPRVIEQDGSQGADTGLVAARLSSGLDVYLQPETPGGARWTVTLESRDEVIDLSAAQATTLSEEFATLAALCAFLETRSGAGDDA